MIRLRILPVLLAIVLHPWALDAQESDPIPTPLSHFGFTPGEHRRLADWKELTAYFERVALASDRMTLDTLGLSTGGRPFVMFTITSPANHARLDVLRDIHLRLADPRRIGSREELERLKEEARTVVLITSNIHSNEVGAGQMPANLVYRLATSDDPAVLEILDRVILLHIPSLNPDGAQLVADWYRRYVGTRYEGTAPVDLYHPYVGHDNNRDWYALTQTETRLVVEGAHNAWRPMIVHDVHQMGATGARIFVPPYVDPFEPNVDPLLVSAINQAGSYIAAELLLQGKTGVVTGAQYDLFSPSRSYSHYHGGVRILTETASARLASPEEVRPSDLAAGREFDATLPSMNFPAPWPGGSWGLPQIVDYQESAALALLTNAARNRPFWVDNFYEVNRRAVERWPSWPDYWVIPAGQASELGMRSVLRTLTLGSVEVRRAEAPFTIGGRLFGAGSYVIPMNQPYASWAQTLLEAQSYPELNDYPGGPLTRPYDVTAHTLPLLMGVEAVQVRGEAPSRLSDPIATVEVEFRTPEGLSGSRAPRIGLYRGSRETIPAGWTRWLFDRHGIDYESLGDDDVRRGALARRFEVVIFQDQPRWQIVEGWSQREMPREFSGGLGREGMAALRDFVHEGGRLIAIESATDLAIELFDLPLRDRLAYLPSSSFFVPGSIVRLDVEPGVRVGEVPVDIAWMWRTSRAFDVLGRGLEVVARYGEGDPALSGWVVGGEHIAGQPAIVRAGVGRGSLVLFGFQPNYRGQSIATWPLLFGAITSDF